MSQIELLKEERRALLDDNDTLNAKLNDLYFENEALRKEVQTFDFLREGEDKERRMF